MIELLMTRSINMTYKIGFRRTSLRVLCIAAAIFSSMIYAQDAAAAPAATANYGAQHPALAQDPSLTNEKDVYPNGYANRPSKPEEEKLSIFGRVMFRAISGQQDTAWAPQGNDYGTPDFNFRRLRLGAIYQGGKSWGGMVHMRLENAMSNAPSVGPSRGLVQEASLWYQWKFLNSKVQAGMINQPFAREYQVSSANLVVIERGMVIDALQQFDNGVLVKFDPLAPLGGNYSHMITVYGMVGTGGGGGGDFDVGRREDLYSCINKTSGASCQGAVSPFFYGRVNFNPLGVMKRGKKLVGWVEGEEMFLTENKISFGAGFAGTNETRITNSMRDEYRPRSSSGAFNLVSMPLTLSSNTNGLSGSANNSSGQCDAGTQCSLFAQTYDLKGSLYGIYFDAAYQYLGGAAGQNITGFTGTLGYNIHISKGTWIMPIVRYDFMKGNFKNVGGHSNTSELSSDPANQLAYVWVGVNLFIDKNLAKIQVAYAKSLNNQYAGYSSV
jgi:hypothetical protein